MSGVNPNPEWVWRGKTIEQLIKELQSFSDQSLKVEISMDGGDTSRPISLVGKVRGKCVLMNMENDWRDRCVHYVRVKFSRFGSGYYRRTLQRCSSALLKILPNSKSKNRMKIHPIANAWRSSFGENLPVGYLCRDSLADNWLRIHSLPKSKQYADTAEEREELLRRQNVVAKYVLGEGSSCLLFFTYFDETKIWPSNLLIDGRKPEHVMSAEREGDIFQFFSLDVTWNDGEFNDLIMAIADEEDERIVPTMFVNLERQSAYAPYAGGADLFFSSQKEAQQAKIRFESWLPLREYGM